MSHIQTTGYVYVLHAPECGRVKIGRSKNPDKRAMALDTQGPVPTKLLTYVYFGERAEKTERWFHYYFQDHRKNGEWFDDSILPNLMFELGKCQQLAPDETYQLKTPETEELDLNEDQQRALRICQHALERTETELDIKLRDVEILQEKIMDLEWAIDDLITITPDKEELRRLVNSLSLP